MAAIKPILNFTKPIKVTNLDDTRIGRLMIEYNGELVDVLSGHASRVLDIIELNHVLVSPSVLEDWIDQSEVGKVLNRWIIDNHEIVTIGINDSEYGFLLSTDGKLNSVFMDHSIYASRMMDKLRYSLGVVQDLRLGLEKIQGKYTEDDPFIQLVETNNISDYVSFEHLVKSTGRFEEIKIYSDDLYKGTDQLFYNDDKGEYPGSMMPNTNQDLRYEYYKKEPIYDRIVKEGDIIDLTLGYRITESVSAGEHLVKYEFDDSYDNVLPADGVDLGLNQVSYKEETNELVYDQDEVLPKIYYESQDNTTEIRYNGFSLLRGRTRATSVTTLIKVGQSMDSEGNITPLVQNIGDDFLIEITNDRLVVYSINPQITEYIIKSCRKINLMEAPTEPPTESPTEDPTEYPTYNPTEHPTYHPTEAPTDSPSKPPYVVPDLEELGLTVGYPSDQNHYFYELSGVRPIRIYEAYSDCGKHFICYWDEDYIIEMGDDYLTLPFRVIDFFNQEDKVLKYITHDSNGYETYGIIGKDTFQLDELGSTIWQFRGNDEGHWELVAKLNISTYHPSEVIMNPELSQFNHFMISDSKLIRYKLGFHNGVDSTDGYSYQLVGEYKLPNRVEKGDKSLIKNNGDYSIQNNSYYLGISLIDDTIDTDTNTLYKKFGVISTTYKYPAFR